MAVMSTPIPFIFNLLQLLILVPSDANDAVDERACIVAPGQLQVFSTPSIGFLELNFELLDDP